MKKEDIKFLKERERKFREGDLPFGAWTLQTKTKWWNTIELQNVLNPLTRQKGRKLLDVGCSDGRFLEYFNKKIPGKVLFGIDFAFNPLKVLNKLGFPKHLICGDVCEMPFKGQVFDAAVSIQVVQHIPTRPERIRCLKGICNGLTEGGLFVISLVNQKRWHETVENGKEGNSVNNPSLYVYLYDPEDLAQDLDEAGFVDIKIVGINNVPEKYLKWIGVLGVWADFGISQLITSLSLRRGCYLLAVCRKKGKLGP